MNAAEVRLARREAALRFHPDRGGDPAEFIAAMRALDEPVRAGSRVQVRSTVHSRTLRALSRSRRRLGRRLRQKLPKSLPGARRFGCL